MLATALYFSGIVIWKAKLGVVPIDWNAMSSGPRWENRI